MKKITTYKWAFIIILFLVLITALRLSWIGFLTKLDYPQSPSVQQGVLDLRGWYFSDHQTLPLNGEWEFYPSTFFTSKDQINVKPIDLMVPNNWEKAFKDNRFYQYGTYRLRILIDNKDIDTFGIRINKLNNASAIYVNGQRMGKSGQVSTTEEQHKGSNIPYTTLIKPVNNEVDLMIQVSSNRNNGGIAKPIRFGTIEAIRYQTLLSTGLQLLLCIILLLHSVYACILYFIKPSINKSLLYFSLLLICAVVSVLGSDDKLLYNWINVQYEWEVKITFLSYIGVGAFIPLIIDRLYPPSSKDIKLLYFIIYCLLYTLFVLVSPTKYILLSSKVLLLAVLLFPIILSTIKLRSVKVDKGESIFLILGCSSIGINIIWATLKSNTVLEMMHYPFDLIFAILCFAAFWFKRFFRISSEARQLAEKLQSENNRKDEFLVNTSHELRNPLHGMMNIIQMLLENRTNSVSNEQQNHLTILLNVSKRMSLMLNDLLDITRLKEKTIQLQLERIHIKAVVIGVLDLAKAYTDGKPIQLKVEISDSFPPVMADETKLVQILFNLIHNAVKFTDKGIITIRATVENKMAHIHIEDTGIGIENDILSKIFNPYEQGSVNSTRASGGFGLGLSICKQLVELHLGTLSVQSTPGKGSIFTFTLPLFQSANELEKKQTQFIESELSNNLKTAIEIAPTQGNEYSKGKRKILAVDDDPINLKILITILNNDYTVTTVTSGHQAMEKLETESYDLVISDVMMPGVSGYELTRLIRKRFSISELPVLLLTARSKTEDLMTGFQSGANDYISKPVDSWELRIRVHALIRLKVSIEEHIRMEGAWLQSQIHPHFIFNTLNSIAALAEIDVTKMQELLEEFSHYLRLSFDFHNTDPVVPLDQELSFVRSYLYIEKVRFGNRLSVQWDIDTDRDVFLPPLSIQPLVENAVKHGILKKENGGTVYIHIKKYSDHIKVSVIDTGKGITDRELDELFIEKNSLERTSVGIRNVDRRLKQLYGKGLLIQSIPNNGTTVSFYIPHST